MSKPLVLTLFPKLERPRVGYAIESYRRQCKRELLLMESKRFTEAELSAEFHSARADWNEASRHPSKTYWTPLGVDEDATEETAMKRATVFLHFASRPHYDEVTA